MNHNHDNEGKFTTADERKAAVKKYRAQKANVRRLCVYFILLVTLSLPEISTIVLEAKHNVTRSLAQEVEHDPTPSAYSLQKEIERRTHEIFERDRAINMELARQEAISDHMSEVQTMIHVRAYTDEPEEEEK